jgi:sortase A
MNARMDKHRGGHKAPKQRKTRRPVLRRLGWLLIVVGIGVAMYPVFTMGYGAYRQSQMLAKADAAAKAYRDRAAKATEEQKRLMKTTPIGLPGPWPVTKIIIPKIGVEQIVQEGITPVTLTKSPGHYPKTQNPGQIGWCAIAGHRITYSAPFDRLNELVAGDQIILETRDARFVFLFYEIETVLDTADLEMPKTDTANVILTTCEPKTGSSHRLIARGKLAPYPASRYLVPPSVVPPSGTLP